MLVCGVNGAASSEAAVQFMTTSPSASNLVCHAGIGKQRLQHFCPGNGASSIAAKGKASNPEKTCWQRKPHGSRETNAVDRRLKQKESER
mmetsp:Transcript_25206/g.99458  ORF Transcript_25206/g.99458 Transcript_25206/m.99458 type:complete len:90 (-) Transcript_25206:1949-2218(-)